MAGHAISGTADKASAPSTAPPPPSGALPSTPSPPSRPAVKTVPAAKPSPAPAPEPPVEPVRAGSYIDGLKAAGLSEITVDELIALKVQGVTPEYVRAIREYGVHMVVGLLVRLKVQGVTPEYI